MLKHDRARIERERVWWSDRLVQERGVSVYLYVQLQRTAGALAKYPAVEIEEIKLTRGREKPL